MGNWDVPITVIEVYTAVFILHVHGMRFSHWKNMGSFGDGPLQSGGYGAACPEIPDPVSIIPERGFSWHIAGFYPQSSGNRQAIFRFQQIKLNRLCIVPIENTRSNGDKKCFEIIQEHA